jgi:hypothetical protein
MTRTPIATRLMPAPYGGFIRVPAYVVAEPRKRGAISDWLREQREAVQASGRN